MHIHIHIVTHTITLPQRQFELQQIFVMLTIAEATAAVPDAALRQMHSFAAQLSRNTAIESATKGK